MAHDLGQIVNNLGCNTNDLDDDTIITDIVVICKTWRTNGKKTIKVINSEGTDWITRFGMIRAAWTKEDETLRQHNR